MHRRVFKQIALGVVLGTISFTYIPSNNIVFATELKGQYIYNSNDENHVKQPVEVKNNKLSEKNQWINLDVNYPTVIFKDQDKSIIQDKINKQFFSDAMWSREKMIKDSKEAYEDSIKYKYDFRPYSLDIQYNIDKNNNGILSAHSTVYYYTGGAHALSYTIPYNYRLEDGKELELKDLFKEGYDYRKVMNEKIKELMDKIDAEYKAEYIKGGGKEEEYKSMFFEEFKGVKDDQKFYITNNDIVIYYDHYEIAPYAFGMPKFNIPISSLKDGLGTLK